MTEQSPPPEPDPALVRRRERVRRTRLLLASARDREIVRRRLVRGYLGGLSIRALVREHDISYGTIHLLLREGGVVLRGRGGPNHQRRGDEDPS